MQGQLHPARQMLRRGSMDICRCERQPISTLHNPSFKDTPTMIRSMHRVGLPVVLIAWSIPGVRSLSSSSQQNVTGKNMISRRAALVGSTGAIFGISSSIEPAYAEAMRAVGSDEEKCRAAGTCLENFELDGAVGWGWGGKDRCDALDPNCGSNGKLRDSPLVGKPIPNVDPKDITSVAAIQIEIGRDESGVLKLGFYDDNDTCRSHVTQFLQFLSDEGLVTTNAQNTVGRETSGISLKRSGTVTNIIPSQAITFGVPSQSYSFARSRGRAKAGDDFIPQNRPKPLSATTKIRPHDIAGLISVPTKGLGYGGTGFESTDECFESAFTITANAAPSLDASNIVIGQILDAPSMAFLERLANLPTQRGIRGVIPGQTFGPPLPKVAVREVQVTTVSSSS